MYMKNPAICIEISAHILTDLKKKAFEIYKTFGLEVLNYLKFKHSKLFGFELKSQSCRIKDQSSLMLIL